MNLSEKDKVLINKEFKSYSLRKFDKDYKLFISNSFKKNYKKFSNIEYWYKKFEERMIGLGVVSLIGGIYVGEYNKNKDLHSHSLIYFESKLSDNDVRNKMWKWWESKGSVEIKKYDVKEYEDYISKDLYKGYENMFNYVGEDKI